jgi:hypothetical protein
VFDHDEERLIFCKEFTDADRAVLEYGIKERELEGRRRVEVVLIGSDSIQTIRRTHASYFDYIEPMSEYLRGLNQ